MPSEKLTMLRIYLQRGDNKKATTFWGRFFEKPLSVYLIQAALKHGIQYAFLNFTTTGFVRGAKGVSYDMGEVPSTTVPVCIEMLAPRTSLDTFVKAHAETLNRATLVFFEGSEVVLPERASRE